MNGVDDDDDGIIDEMRDNDAGVRIDGAENIISYIQSTYDVQKFLTFYNYASVDEIPAVQRGLWWTGEEDLDWGGYDDVSGNGIWDDGEPLNDDVGSDGLASFRCGVSGAGPGWNPGTADLIRVSRTTVFWIRSESGPNRVNRIQHFPGSFL